MNSKHYDVVIMGGGLAGLSLAVQLKRRAPKVSILVIEKSKFPVPEAAHKVGESTLEIAARYFGRHVGMTDHLENEQLVKPGLRYFFTAGDNSRIEDRAEIGHTRLPKYRSYQLDRGRFENALSVRARELGAEVADGAKVIDLSLSSSGDRPHRVGFQRGEAAEDVTCDWVVDATGRAGKIKKLLHLGRPIDHSAQATWFRVNAVIDIDDWSQDPEWRARAEKGVRRLATNHLMGKGYWVWLIPLASDSTSVGIVSDRNVHDFGRLNHIDKALDWLDEHEPQCAQAVRAHRDRILDFRTMAQYALNCDQLFSENRWALVGEAGCFADPLYSPGSDFIAVGNCMTTDLILRSLSGQDIKPTVEAFNYLYKTLFEGTFILYPGQYPGFGSSVVSSAKIAWDSYSYWGISCLLFFQGKLLDLEFLNRVQAPLERLGTLNFRMQQVFRDWGTKEDGQSGRRFTNQHDLKHLYNWHCKLEDTLTDDELVQRIHENVTVMEQLAVAIFQRAARRFDPQMGERPLNPAALVDLDPNKWDRDVMFDPSYAVQATGDLGKEFGWVLRD
jgi:flavin-dependent dehydrogenase